MIDFELSEDQRVLQASVREMCERLIVPNARRWDEEERFPHEVIPPLGEMGLLGMQIPEAYGGAGMKFHDYVIALEEVAHADASDRADDGVAQLAVHGAHLPGRQRGAEAEVPAAAGERQGAGRRGG